jgi:hypothetical protein
MDFDPAPVEPVRGHLRQPRAQSMLECPQPATL